MDGDGNDFIIIDNRQKQLPSHSFIELAKKLCQRNFSIGADQLIILQKSKNAYCSIEIFNQDGSKAETCGNAFRCIGKLLFEEENFAQDTLIIETHHTLIHIKKQKKLFAVSMGTYSIKPQNIGITTTLSKLINFPLKLKNHTISATCVSLGNPHTCVFVDNLNFDIQSLGKEIENHQLFSNKTNVEFIKLVHKNKITLRIWERGSGETLSCGSGICASAVALILNKKAKNNEKITVKTKGGETNVLVKDNKETIFSGSASINFKGFVKL